MQNSNINNNSNANHGVEKNRPTSGEQVSRMTETGFEFGRLFSRPTMPSLLKASTCKVLGDHMTAITDKDTGDSDIPAGYTYFGQFVDHDISFDVTSDKGEEASNNSEENLRPTNDNSLTLDRSPSLDLDNLYGTLSAADTRFLEIDGFSFKLGDTLPTGATINPPEGQKIFDGPIKADLPRSPGGGNTEVGQAMIGDPRNDENLAVAQIHLTWLRFHNKIAQTLHKANPSVSPMLTLEMARNLVTLHYQHIVFHDFIRRIIPKSIYENVIVKGNRKHFTIGAGEIAKIPLEFSVAAYRYGHSQVRAEYNWNVNFKPVDGLSKGTFDQLFRFSQVSGGIGTQFPSLPTNWVPDFRRLFDLSNAVLPNLENSETGALNMAMGIDPYLTPELGELPAVRRAINKAILDNVPALPFANLASLNLRRGVMRALPTGQEVATQMNIPLLDRADLRKALDDDFISELETLNLIDRLPLWLYILIESSAKENGKKLGSVGGTIVAETFRTLVLTSRTTILRSSGDWEPNEAVNTLGLNKPIETIADILLWLDENEPIINPIQDERNVRTS